MPGESLRLNDGQSHCRLMDPTGAMLQAPISEISTQGALLVTDIQLEINAYIDITLVLKNLAPRQLFAHVVSCGTPGLRLRWLHFDPGEEGKLRSLLESYQRTQGTARREGTGNLSGGRRQVKPRGEGEADAAGDGQNGRRLVRPSASAITPFSDGATPTEPGRVGTRRVVRPSQQALTPFSAPPGSAQDHPPAPTTESTRQDETNAIGSRGDESRTNHIVIEPTSRFDQLVDERKKKDLEISARPKQADPSVSPPSPSADAPSAPAVRERELIDSGNHPILPEGPVSDALEANPKSSPKTTIIGKDGRMDIGASIRSHAKTVRASELAARHDKVRVLNMGTIKALIQEAVEEAAAHLTRSLSEAERKRMLEEAEEGFQERLKAFATEKTNAEERSKQLVDQLESARRLLDEERKRSIKADQFTVSAEGLGEIEDRFQRLLARSVKDGGVDPVVEEELRNLIVRILDSEREKMREREMEAQNAKIALLEKKIGRLAGSLEDTERQRDEAQRLNVFLESQGGGGLRNVFTAGLKDEDPNKAKKLELMKKILDENRTLRQHLGIALNSGDPGEEKASATTAQPAATAPSEPLPEQRLPIPLPAPLPALVAASEETAPPTEGEPVTEELQVNPDDEPWEIKPLVDDGPAQNSSGIKRISAFASAKTAPPLERGGKP